MSDPELLNFVLRVLRTYEPMDLEEVLWRTDGKYAPVTFWAGCNDCFWWATADTEEITPENIHLLEQAKKDCGPDHRDLFNILFAAQVRKMRPQGAFYRAVPKELWSLFDACGPERNPTERGNTPRPEKT